MKVSGDVYELKVTLRGSKPAIWRRVQVRSDVTLLKLHDILQVVMGWTDSHLHQFIVKGDCYGKPEPEFPGDRHDEGKTRLHNVVRMRGDRIVYEYDFGDGWTHDIILEEVLVSAPGARVPQVMAGRRACPPEDCGGVQGHQRLLQILRHPAHPEHGETLEWAGEDFDPEAFDIQERNRALHGGWYLPKPHA